MASSNMALERLQEAVVDGRTENARYRQDQLQSLHKTLRDEASAITAAIAADTGAPSTEVETEFYLGMEAVRHAYETIQFARELEDEYRVAKGKDYKERRVGYGLVVIRPAGHSRFYSVVSALAPAISAGNAVVLELQDTLLQVDSILRSALPKALDINTFHISKTPTDPTVLETALLVDQTGAAAPSTRVLSSSCARVVAVVDRTADVDAAAKAIATARFSFGGTSPFAPDLVLVNEFVKRDFFEACTRHATRAFSRDGTAQTGVRSANQTEESRKAIKEAEGKRQVSSFGSDDFKLVEILDKRSPIMSLKITGRYLPIAPASGLVDAVFNQPWDAPLLASYIFAAPDAAKYMAQYLPSQLAVVNQIPVHLLVGPAGPRERAPEFLYRYSRAMFSVPRPQFVEAVPETFQQVETLLAAGDTSKVSGQTKAPGSLRERAVAALPPTGQPKNEQIGFFESGILLGVSISFPIILSVLGWASYVVGRRGLEWIRLRSN